MPIWADDDHIHPKWVKDATGLPCSSCSAQDISNESRRSDDKVKDGATLRLTIVGEGDGTTDATTLIVKQVPDTGLTLSNQLGLAREALFYRHLASDFPKGSIPKI